MWAVIITVITWNNKQHNVTAKSRYHLKWASTVGVVTISKEMEHDVKFWIEAEAKKLKAEARVSRGRGRGRGQILASLVSRLNITTFSHGRPVLRLLSTRRTGLRWCIPWRRWLWILAARNAAYCTQPADRQRSTDSAPISRSANTDDISPTHKPTLILYVPASPLS